MKDITAVPVQWNTPKRKVKHMEFVNWLMGPRLQIHKILWTNLESMFGHCGARAMQPWDNELYASSKVKKDRI